LETPQLLAGSRQVVEAAPELQHRQLDRLPNISREQQRAPLSDCEGAFCVPAQTIRHTSTEDQLRKTERTRWVGRDIPGDETPGSVEHLAVSLEKPCKRAERDAPAARRLQPIPMWIRPNCGEAWGGAASLGSALAYHQVVLETVSLSWTELARRTWREAIDDDVLGLAAQLSYYFFLALFPAILFLLALASFFPLSDTTDDVGRLLGPFVSPQVLELIQEQMRRLAHNENGGLLTFGVAAALWSSSAALVSIVGAINRAYDIEEGRPWWRVRLVAIGLTFGVALLVLVAFALVLVGPTVAERLGRATGWGAPFEWTWLVLQWPLVFALVTTGIGLIYYFGPDADQDWAWITPGAVAATMLWLLVSLLFKLYIANFTDYEASYGTVGSVIVVLLWFYVSGIALLAGAELNAEIEHASPHGKAPGQKNADGKRLIGARAARWYRDHSAPSGR
jgi:membrane protein